MGGAIVVEKETVPTFAESEVALGAVGGLIGGFLQDKLCVLPFYCENYFFIHKKQDNVTQWFPVMVFLLHAVSAPVHWFLV